MPCGFQNRFVRDEAKAKDYLEIWHRGHFRFQKLQACTNFIASNFVLRGDAFNRVGDACIDQFQPVIFTREIFSVCKAKLQEGGVEQVPCVISGKGPAAEISTF